jgi:hypothetical protein
MIAHRIFSIALLLTLNTSIFAAPASTQTASIMDVNTSAAYLNALQLRDRRAQDLEKAIEISASSETVEFIQAQINELEKQIARYEALGLKTSHIKRRKKSSLGLKIAIGTAVVAGTTVLVASIYDAKNNKATWPSIVTLGNNWSQLCEATQNLFYKKDEKTPPPSGTNQPETHAASNCSHGDGGSCSGHNHDVAAAEAMAAEGDCPTDAHEEQPIAL